MSHLHYPRTQPIVGHVDSSDQVIKNLITTGEDRTVPLPTVTISAGQRHFLVQAVINNSYTTRMNGVWTDCENALEHKLSCFYIRQTEPKPFKDHDENCLEYLSVQTPQPDLTQLRN